MLITKIFPIEVCEEILVYLSVDDIRNGSFVSKHWYNLIGKSNHCMEKLRLKCDESDNLEQFSKIISDSTRLNIYSFNDQTTMDIVNKMQSLEELHTDSTINRL